MQVHEIPAPFANRITVNIGPQGARFTFGESFDGSNKDEKHHTAVWMPMPVVLEFQKLINETLEMALKAAVRTETEEAPKGKNH